MLWKFKLRMRTIVDLAKIIWRTSKRFVFGNGYNIVLAIRPADIGVRRTTRCDRKGFCHSLTFSPNDFRPGGIAGSWVDQRPPR